MFGIRSLSWIGVIVTLVGVVACGSAAEPQPSKDIAVEAAVVEATPTATTGPSAAVQPGSPSQTATELPTEIIEPVSPISPAGTVEVAMQTPPSRSLAPVPGSETAVEAAVADLSQQKGIPADQITVTSVEAMDWPDTSLGCPQEGFMYAQVITPGYLIILEAQGQSYEYHTNQDTGVVLCEQ